MFGSNAIIRFSIIGFLLLLAVSCSRDFERLAKECESGVVLVQTIEYYEMRMNNGASLYFTGSDFDKESGQFKGLSADIDSLMPDVMYGTGFIISDDGKIATNRHVIEGNISEQEARIGMKKIVRALVEALEKAVMNDSLRVLCLKADIIFNPDTIVGLLQSEKDALVLFTERMNENRQMLRLLKHTDFNDIELIYNNDVRIAYNNTFVQNVTELKPCTIRTKSETDDLAIIQLNTKQTPGGRHVFALTERDMLQHYSYWEYLMHLIGKDKNKTLMMIGYNMGIGMALTDEGIISQHTTGTLSRYLAQEREIQYDIPSLLGSSGSPVINHRGQVVAINYARADTVGSFNYGIKEKFLYQLKQKL